MREGAGSSSEKLIFEICSTNKVRLCERSEPQSEPFVGQARSSYIENSFLGGRPPGQTDERRGRFFFRKIDL
jgi:hypothetical protein